jgi:hypothetical protein
VEKTNMEYEHATAKKTYMGFRSFLAPPDLIDAPQLAVVAVLESTLAVTASALLAAYPNMWGERAEIPPIEDACATTLYQQIHSLEETVELYRRILEHRLRPGIRKEAPCLSQSIVSL